jgi:S-adenosyl methyltransferase
MPVASAMMIEDGCAPIAGEAMRLPGHRAGRGLPGVPYLRGPAPAAQAGLRQVPRHRHRHPAANNSLKVAEAVAPRRSHVFYADYDLAVLLTARTLLRRSANGAFGQIDADLLDPSGILA